MPLDDLVQSLPIGRKKSKPSGKKDQVIVYPKLDDSGMNEEKESTAVMAFGRFNPPTVGHEKLIHKVHEVAKEHDGSAHVVASHSEGTSKDPLPQSKKLDYLKKVAPAGVHVSGSSKESPSFLHAAKKLHDAGHKHLVMIAGSDRVDEYKKKLDQYNGKEGHFNFKTIKVVSSGERDPDAEGVQGMSGTKMRAHARAGEHEQFKAGLPKALHPHAKEIADHIRSVKEEVEELEERVVDIRQRRLRAITMKRYQPRLQRARAYARERMAGPQQLSRRAFKQAKTLLRKRFAGPRSTYYQDMTPSDRIILDKQVDPKVKLIKNLVKRIVPRIRQAEVKRLAAVRKGVRVTPQRLPLTMSNELPFDLFNKLYDLAEKYNHTDKELNSLFKKSVQSDIPLSTIVEVYNRGVEDYDELHSANKTAQQFAFDRVNSFINGGKATDIDYDLVNENLRKWFQDKWVRMDTKGNIKGDCAREPGEGKPKCLPLAKARAMDKEDRAAAVLRKRREDPNPERSGPAINVATEEKDACYHKVKARYKVWPSAYASGALAKCRKTGADNWGNKSEEVKIDELKTSTIQSYAQKAGQKLGGNLASLPHADDIAKYSRGKITPDEAKKTLERNVNNRMRGLNRAFKRLASEEAQINEISKETKMRYVAKAAASTNEPKEGEKQSDYLERLHRRMSGIKKALSSTNPTQRFQKEEHGAGDEGTVKLVKRYKNDTPGQNESVNIPDSTTKRLKKITKQLDKSSVVHHKQSMALKSLIAKDSDDVKEEKNCGCGQSPCITYGIKNENFMDGKSPEDKGDMSRHGLKGKSISQLKKVRSSDSASPRAKQLAHWYINMHKGKK